MLIGLLAAALPTAYGARDEPLDDRAVEVILACVTAALAVGVVPFALALLHRRSSAVVVAIGLCSPGAGAIHFAVIRDHFDEYWFYGLFFVVTGLVQLLWAMAVVLRPTRALLAFGALVNAAIIASWIVTRTVGLLIGPGGDEVEPVGLADAMASAFEVVVVLGSVLTLAGGGKRWNRLQPRSAEALTWTLVLLTAVATTLGLLSAMGVAPGVLPPSA
jgi:hypothetical protein